MISPCHLRLLYPQILWNTVRGISTTQVTCGRRGLARVKWLKLKEHPYDSRFPISPKDVARSSSHSGKLKELLSELGREGYQMPQMPGYFDREGKFQYVKEMAPEFVVPDLKDFDLKPYVTYTAPTVIQSPLTPHELFDEIYAKDIVEQYKKGKLDVDQLTPEKILSEGRS